jgi:hypothetical protein
MQGTIDHPMSEDTGPERTSGNQSLVAPPSINLDEHTPEDMEAEGMDRGKDTTEAFDYKAFLEDPAIQNFDYDNNGDFAVDQGHGDNNGSNGFAGDQEMSIANDSNGAVANQDMSSASNATADCNPTSPDPSICIDPQLLSLNNVSSVTMPAQGLSASTAAPVQQPAHQPPFGAQSAGFIFSNNTNSVLTQQKSGMGAIKGTVLGHAQWVGAASTSGNIAQHPPQPQHSVAPIPSPAPIPTPISDFRGGFQLPGVNNPFDLDKPAQALDIPTHNPFATAAQALKLSTAAPAQQPVQKPAQQPSTDFSSGNLDAIRQYNAAHGPDGKILRGTRRREEDSELSQYGMESSSDAVSSFTPAPQDTTTTTIDANNQVTFEDHTHRNFDMSTDPNTADPNNEKKKWPLRRRRPNK